MAGRRLRFTVEETDNGVSIRFEGRVYVFEAVGAGLFEESARMQEVEGQLRAQALWRALAYVAPEYVADESRRGAGLGLVRYDRASGIAEVVSEVPAMVKEEERDG